jgi:hypothetical protein
MMQKGILLVLLVAGSLAAQAQTPGKSHMTSIPTLKAACPIVLDSLTVIKGGGSTPYDTYYYGIQPFSGCAHQDIQGIGARHRFYRINGGRLMSVVEYYPSGRLARDASFNNGKLLNEYLYDEQGKLRKKESKLPEPAGQE